MRRWQIELGVMNIKREKNFKCFPLEVRRVGNVGGGLALQMKYDATLLKIPYADYQLKCSLKHCVCVCVFFVPTYDT